MKSKKVKCIKDYCYLKSGKPRFIEVGDVLYSGYSDRDNMYRVHDKKNKCIECLEEEDFYRYFKEINQPPYVRVYFYPNGNKRFTIKSIEGWLENDYPSNIAIRTNDNCLCKFKFNNIEQMYPINEPSDDIYDEVYKRYNRR